MKITILGCGSSAGMPAIRFDTPGGGWGVCDPKNPKNRRSRASIMVEVNGLTLVIDTSPDFKEQIIRARPKRIDAVLYTHAHADHCHGIDDLRNIYYVNAYTSQIPVYGSPHTINELLKSFGYLFGLEPGYNAHVLKAHTVEKTFNIGNIEITPFPQDHIYLESTGFRIGNFAYSTDVKHLSEEAFNELKNLDLWVVDCIAFEPRKTHSHLAQTLEWIDHVKPKRALLTHLGHTLDYEILRKELPSHVEPAFDGLVVEI